VCFAFDARPPDLPAGLAWAPMAGGAPAEELELTSADGTKVAAAVADAPGADGVGVVILPDVRGLYRFYVELAERFAQAGHPAIALDYFGRTAGAAERDEDFPYTDHVAQTNVDQIQADALAARRALVERAGERPVAAVGFCFGGMQAFLAATSPELDLAGVVGFYGALDGSRRGMPSPPDVADQMRCPVLGLFGGADRAISVEQVEAFDRALERAGVDHEVVVYPDAPHSFFDRSYEEHAEASADAWRRTLAFLDGLRPGSAA
jgi:carboxymethylenebutenolidase